MCNLANFVSLAITVFEIPLLSIEYVRNVYRMFFISQQIYNEKARIFFFENEKNQNFLFNHISTTKKPQIMIYAVVKNGFVNFTHVL